MKAIKMICKNFVNNPAKLILNNYYINGYLVTTFLRCSMVRFLTIKPVIMGLILILGHLLLHMTPVLVSQAHMRAIKIICKNFFNNPAKLTLNIITNLTIF